MKDRETLDLFGGGGGPSEPTSSASPGAVPPASETPDGEGPGGRAGAFEPSEESRLGEPDGPEVLSVSQVNRAVRNLLEREIPPLWIAGEVANWTRARSGHCYFTLKDDQAQIRCVIWRREAARLPMELEDGLRIRGFGSLTLFEGRGEFQFSVREVVGEEGEGLWRLAFERLRLKLEAEGLLDPSRRRPIPRFPRTVGVVTSPTGAAIRDILSVIRRRAPWTRVLVRGARVQGEGAAAELARAIRILGESGRVDLLIVGRGGGSMEDLWAFNEEVVARAIAESPVPVISAVGHEVDVTIADLVADLRAPTPSAGAEAAVQDGESLLELLRALRPRLARGLRRSLEVKRLRLTGLGTRLAGAARGFGEPRRRRLERQGERLRRVAAGLVPPRRERLARLEERGVRAMTRILEHQRRRLAGLAGRVETLSPLSTLRRGYAVPLDAEGRLLRERQAFVPGLRFTLRVWDGRVACQALGSENGGGNGLRDAG